MDPLWKTAKEQLDTVLERVARQRSLITYSDLANEITAVPLTPESPGLARLLSERQAEDIEANGPLFTSLVVGRRTNKPGKGFFGLSKNWFILDDEDQFWLNEVAASHNHYLRRRQRTGPVRVSASPSRPAVFNTVLDDQEFIISFFK